MSKYELGPNGAILTSLNLFASKFNVVQEAMEMRRQEVSHFLVDTPGQIEAFTWSASGKIISESLSKIYPTVLAYVMDIQSVKIPLHLLRICFTLAVYFIDTKCL